MSHSTSNAISSTSIPQTTLNEVNAEEVMRFMWQEKKIKLTDIQIAEIKTAFATNSDTKKLASIVADFIKSKANFQPLVGLTKNEVETLKEFLNIRNKFKDIDKNEMEKAKYDALISNEKNILPLNQIVNWWTTNLDALTKTQVWEEMAKLTIAAVREQVEMGETDIKSQLNKLNIIKHEWIHHHEFAGYSSEHLLQFYRDYVLVLEDYLAQELKTKRQHPEIIYLYIEELLSQTQTIKKKVILSMLHRLECADYYGDFLCDDLLRYTCDIINERCNINIQPDGKGVKPKKRRSLTPELIDTFIEIIEKFCKAFPHKEIELFEQLNQISFCKRPAPWLSGNGSDNHSIKLAVSSHLLNYFYHHFPKLLGAIGKDAEIVTTILESDTLSDESFVINKLYNLLQLAKQDHVKHLSKRADELSNNASKIICSHEKKFDASLEEISMRLGVNIENALDSILNNVFADKEIEFDAIIQVASNTDRARLFNKYYLKNDFYAPGDIILALAHRIMRELVNKGKLDPKSCHNMLRLMMSFYSQIRSAQIDQFREIFQKLPLTTERIKEAKRAEQLHCLVNQLEIPFLSEDHITTATNRHKHIAQMLDEKWIDINSPIEPNNDIQRKINLMIEYLENVLIKLVQPSRCVNLDNFDSTQDCILCTKLNNHIRQKHATPIQVKLTGKIKNEYEALLSSILNDHLSIKSHLLLNATNQIDTKKLFLLRKKVEAFFSDANHKKNLIHSINKSCFSLLKTYIIECIQQDKKPDINQIHEINEILETNLCHQLCHDDGIKKLLAGYISSYDGTTSHLSLLLTELVPPNAECEALIVKYAQKRLEYLKTGDVDPDDYRFFSHYTSIPEVAILVEKTKIKLRENISTAIIDPTAKWDGNIAAMIEFFGEDHEVNAYRVKFLVEIINTDKGRSSQIEIKINHFTHFLSRVNKARLFDGKIADIKTPIAGNITLDKYFDILVKNKEWSLLTEKIIKHCGSRAQQNELHFLLLSTHLDHRNNFSGTWLGSQINTLANHKSDNNDFGSSLMSDMTKLFYQELLGDNHIKQILEKVDLLLKELQQNTTDDKQRAPDKKRYEEELNIIRCIKPLQAFHAVFSSNSALKAFFIDIDEIEKKLLLHHELIHTINRNSFLLDVSDKNIILHNLILTFTKAIKSCEEKDILSEKNIGQFIQFCDREILEKIQSALNQPNYTADFKTLHTLANLLIPLSSDSFKHMLLLAHQNEINENPLWLSLVNHIDERKFILQLEESLNGRPPSVEFDAVLQFAKKLSSLKHSTHHLIKQHFFRDNKIGGSKLNKPEHSLVPANLPNKQILKTWQACVVKLCDNELCESAKPRYVNFLIKFVTKVSNEILLRSHKDKTLLSGFIKQLEYLPQLKKSLAGVLSSNLNSPAAHRASGLWPALSEFDASFKPLQTISEQAYALQLLQLTEDYIESKVPAPKLSVFKEACNDTNIDRAKKIKSLLKIKDDGKAIRLINAHTLLIKLQEIVTNKHSLQSFNTLLQIIVKEANENTTIAKSKGYTKFLQTLRSLALNNPAARNDKDYSLLLDKKIQSKNNTHYRL